MTHLALKVILALWYFQRQLLLIPVENMEASMIFHNQVVDQDKTLVAM